MSYLKAPCTETNNCMPLRKGLAAIASRRSGLVSEKTNTSLNNSRNIAAPKEISAAKCATISMLSL